MVSSRRQSIGHALHPGCPVSPARTVFGWHSNIVFIVFEGGEGAGKTTQCRALAAYLQEQHGLQVVFTSEPGGTELGAEIRRIVVDGGDIPAKAEALLFLADRAVHVEEVIRPALAAGKVVICDRFVDSTVVYQGIVRGLGKMWIGMISSWITGTIVPDLTILLDVDPQIGVARARWRGDTNRFDDEDATVHRRIRSGFLDVAKAKTNVRKRRYAIVDASRSADLVTRDVRVAAECVLVDSQHLARLVAAGQPE